MEIREKVAVVTGAGSGIGRAVVQRLAHEGAAVVVADVDEDAGSNAVPEIHAEGGRAAFLLVAVASEADVQWMVAFVGEEFGSLDVLVNNAGGVAEPYFPESEPAQWGRAVDLNLCGTMLGIHFVIRAMQKRGGGAIVNISSYAPIDGGSRFHALVIRTTCRGIDPVHFVCSALSHQQEQRADG